MDLNTSVTVIAHADHVDPPWSSVHETEPTPTSAEVQRADRGCGCRYFKAKRSRSKKHNCSQHSDDTLQAATVRSL